MVVGRRFRGIGGKWTADELERNLLLVLLEFPLLLLRPLLLLPLLPFVLLALDLLTEQLQLAQPLLLLDRQFREKKQRK